MTGCGVVLLQDGEPLLLEGNAGPLRITSAPTPGLPILLENGEPLLLECDGMGALVYTHDVPVPPGPPDYGTAPLQADNFALGGALVRWELGSTQFARYTKTHAGVALFGAQVSIVADGDVVRAARANFDFVVRADAQAIRTVNAEATVTHAVRISAKGVSVSEDEIRRELEQEEERAMFTLLRL